jgi:oligopeptidase B
MARLHAAHLAALAATSTALAAAAFGCGPAAGPREPAPPSPTPAGDTAAAGREAPAGKPATRPGTAPATPSTPSGPVPIAEQRPYKVESPFGARNDPYYWLRDDTRKDPKVLAYLNAEKVYADAMLAPVAALEQTLFGELRARIKEDDSSVPVLDNGYWYYSRYETGKQYPIFARKKGALTAPEEVLLDGNQLAVGHAFYAMGGFRVSRDNRLIAWGEDTVGRNQYTLRVKDLRTGALLPDTATNMSPSMAWANDHKTLFYVGKDPTTLRTDRVFRHVLGGKPELVFKEDDGQYYVGVSATKSRRYIAVVASATTNSEFRLIDADRPASAPKVFLPREKDHLYEIEHLDGRFVMRTNADAKNFRLVEIAPGKEGNRKAWKEIIAHSPDVLIEDFALYHGFIAVSVRTGGLRKVRVLPKGKPAFFLDAPDAAYAMTVNDTPDADAKRVRFAYDSLTTPRSVYEADVLTKERKLLKQQPVPTFDSTKYTSEYLHATAKDGAKVPISVVYRKDTPRDGTAPLLIDGYGSYGFSMEPWFNSMAVSLLDRGWVFAIAHIRGGQEMGRAWYEDGKLMKKMNTFTDFIAATEHLVAQRYGKSDQVFALGGSAGGLLMGAILNLRPELYRGVVAQVPFVDVVTTMLDESIPLTTNEFDEWGNPKAGKEIYDYMLAYSPYDNVRATAYPSIFVQTGLWDSQVQYFEPAKWVARLRAMKTDDNLLVMDIDMSSGHGGASGRFDRLKQTARALAFMLHVRERPDRRAR